MYHKSFHPYVRQKPWQRGARYDALPIAAEVNITAGIGMYLVGLPDNAVRESQERIRAAFENCSYKMSGKKVVVNLSPADIRKEGSPTT